MKKLRAGEYLTTLQAAGKLKVSDSRVRQFCRQGRLGVKVGRNYLIHADELAMFSALPNGRPRKSSGR